MTKLFTISYEKRAKLTPIAVVALCIAGALTLGSPYSSHSSELSLIASVVGSGASFFAFYLYLGLMERFGGPGIRQAYRQAEKQATPVFKAVRLAVGGLGLWLFISSPSSDTMNGYVYFIMATSLFALMKRGTQRQGLAETSV